MSLIFDGKEIGKFQLVPMVTFVQRAQMIQDIIDAVVSDDSLSVWNQEFAIAYYMIQTYTDIQFSGVEIPDIDGETEEEHKARQRNADISNAFEFIHRSTIRNMLEANVLGYDEIITEIHSGIRFRKSQLLNNTSWNKVGDKIQDLLDAAAKLMEDPNAINNLATLASGLLTEDSGKTE
jgi:hypothetical protein